MTDRSCMTPLADGFCGSAMHVDRQDLCAGCRLRPGHLGLHLGLWRRLVEYRVLPAKAGKMISIRALFQVAID
jgi:hypothetical protein